MSNKKAATISLQGRIGVKSFAIIVAGFKQMGTPVRTKSDAIKMCVDILARTFIARDIGREPENTDEALRFLQGEFGDTLFKGGRGRIETASRILFEEKESV
jgi:hypothetical protein